MKLDKSVSASSRIKTPLLPATKLMVRLAASCSVIPPAAKTICKPPLYASKPADTAAAVSASSSIALEGTVVKKGISSMAGIFATTPRISVFPGGASASIKPLKAPAKISGLVISSTSNGPAGSAAPNSPTPPLVAKPSASLLPAQNEKKVGARLTSRASERTEEVPGLDAKRA